MSHAGPARDAFKFWTSIEVRWGDMDAMGHVNNAVYFKYCESARIELLRGIGIGGRAEGRPQGPTLVHTACDFKREVKYPATLEIGVRIEAMTQRSFRMQYGMFPRGAETPVAVAISVNAWMDYAAGHAVRIPDDLRAALAAYQ
ncbi:MAG: acyl-CoA thioesterase [Blastocatellia bacterium]